MIRWTAASLLVACAARAVSPSGRSTQRPQSNVRISDARMAAVERLALQSPRRLIESDTPFVFSVRDSDPGDRGASVRLESNPYPYRRFRGTVPQAGGNPIDDATIGLDGRGRFDPVTPDRNTEFRAVLGAAVKSARVTLYVDPGVGLSIGRDLAYLPRVYATFGVDGHAAPNAPTGAIVYFYRPRTPASRYRLFARRRVRFPSTTVSFIDRDAVGMLAFARRRVLADMDAPFRSRTCGRAILTRPPRDSREVGEHAEPDEYAQHPFQ